MINLFNTQIESISVHRVGNKSRGEDIFLSKKPYKLNDEITPLLKEYFFKPFREIEEQYYKFSHDVDMAFHYLDGIVNQAFRCSKLFDFHDGSAEIEFHEFSKLVAKHLNDQSNHPHIKAGEVSVLYLKNVVIDNHVVDAIGIFKSEVKSDFIQFEQKDDYLDVVLQHGANLSKLDKGCIIFNYKAEEGYKILSVDTNRYDARYWLDHFLSVEMFDDENYKTKNYLKFVQGFAKDVILPAEDKKEQIMFENRALHFFAKNDEFVESDFIKEVIDNPDLIPEFKTYKDDKGGRYSIEDASNFNISNTAVTDARKKFKRTIELDTDMSIKVDIINPETAEKFLEKGWDEEKQMYYYLVYFNKETN